MSFNPNMSLEEFIKLAEKYAEEMYSPSITAENSENLVYKESLLGEAEERKERMERKNMLTANMGENLSNASMEVIKQKVHTTGNVKVGKFMIKIRNYKMDKDKNTTVTLDIHEEKNVKNHFGSMSIPQRVNVVKDYRFRDRTWLKYFAGTTDGGTMIPIKVAAEIVRWCQAIGKIGAFF